MEFLQEPVFTAFLALILSFVVAKIVFFAISNSTANGGSTVVCSVNEGGGVSLNRGLRVRSSKGKKRVKFVDDVEVRRVDRYEGSDNLVLSEDVVSVGEAIVGEESVGGESDERVDQFGVNQDFGVEKIEEKSFDDGGGQSSESERVEMLIEKEGVGDEVDEEKPLVSVVVEEEKIEVGLGGGDAITDKKVGNEAVDYGGIDIGDMEEREESVDDDWEGIERSEMEKVFAEAINYVEYGGRKEKGGDHLGKLSSDVQMELYGLHKVAVEGPCGGPQPMALKVSARAKWNAWQKLGNMSQEAAMEQYIKVLSDNIHGWMHDYSSADDDDEKKMETVGEISEAKPGRKSELIASIDDSTSTGRSSVEKQDGVV